jgi:hypothetical protein
MKERNNNIITEQKNDNKNLIETTDDKTIDDDKEGEENTINISARDNNNIVIDKTEESTKPQHESPRNKKNEERQIGNNTKAGTKSVKKKMTETQENLPFRHVCDDIAMDDTTQYVRLYCQNVSGIFDRDGIGLDSAFKEINQAGADIFTFNETHGDESNATARRGMFRLKLRFFERFDRGARVTRVTMPTARYLATRKILKNS